MAVKPPPAEGGSAPPVLTGKRPLAESGGAGGKATLSDLRANASMGTDTAAGDTRDTPSDGEIPNPTTDAAVAAAAVALSA